MSSTDFQPHIILTALDAGLEDAWRLHCGDFPNVTIHRGSIFDISCDALVSPANSFGFMDGGIDMRYTERFGWEVQNRLQEAIVTRHYGELLVGAAEIVETEDLRFPYIIAAPTMRVPMVLGYTVNPYLAARAVLLLIKHGRFSDGEHAGERIADYVQSVAFPGLGTGVGRVGPNTCAHQVSRALEEVVGEGVAFPTSWVEAVQRHKTNYMDFIGEVEAG
ncbi:tail protein [Capsulimonas corticalis]|uniref:Tail protein n=1 Tax=Capsulimonas corticalis TaxID=2219043 RepID=A0A402CTG6_9BACT|nr:macro domain-containing protein [Capsulimonas corticalis]BDI30734.1 tail protein [Capsulimonas corticalis]